MPVAIHLGHAEECRLINSSWRHITLLLLNAIRYKGSAWESEVSPEGLNWLLHWDDTSCLDCIALLSLFMNFK